MAVTRVFREDCEQARGLFQVPRYSRSRLVTKGRGTRTYQWKALTSSRVVSRGAKLAVGVALLGSTRGRGVLAGV